MVQNQGATLTAADLQSVVWKLDQFSRELPPGEQAALSELFRQTMIAAAGDGEVQGYALATIPLPEGDIMRAFGVA